MSQKIGAKIEESHFFDAPETKSLKIFAGTTLALIGSESPIFFKKEEESHESLAP